MNMQGENSSRRKRKLDWTGNIIVKETNTSVIKERKEITQFKDG